MKLKFLRIFLTFILTTLSFYIDAQSLYFPPTGNNVWDTISPTRLGWCNSKIDTFLNFLEKKNTKAFVLLKDGKIVIEKYFGNFKQDSIWYWASAGKTLTSFAVGIAQQEGYLKISDTSSKYLGKNWTNCTETQESKITIKHQLTMSSGLDDGVTDPYCTDKLCLKYKADAGTRWAYHNAPYTLLDKVIESSTGKNLNIYLSQKLLTPTGMTGLFIKSGYNNIFISTARTMARFGLLILNKGTWNGNKLMTDTNYFTAMTNTSQNMNLSYGYLWWLNGKGKFMVPGLQYVFNYNLFPNAPNDMIAALGKNGQFINIVPSQNIVLLRMGNIPASSEVPISFNDTIWQKINNFKCKTGEINSISKTEVTVYPNPFTTKPKIIYNSKNANFKLVSAVGLVIYEGKNIENFDFDSLKNGIYFISCTDYNSNKTTNIKIIKNKF
ncbi:MAG: serine hydrolase [Bacteroidetes bacterium]|nr:serine hydrolase [Bacteroidota bacterium]